jgi:hypothetical protein
MTSLIKQPEDFQKQAKLLNLTSWNSHGECRECKYKIGYVFDNDNVYFDPGCTCDLKTWIMSSWSSVASHYHLQNDMKLQWDQFWGFK